MIDRPHFVWETELVLPSEAQNMASSNSSPTLSSSPRVLLLLLILGCFRPSSSAALPKHANDRWRNPCDGESHISKKVNVTADEDTDQFAVLSRRSIGLKQIVNSTKNDYIIARFGDANHAEEERLNSGIVITGSPLWNTSNDNMRETLLTCYENLARLAVLTRLTREGEETAVGNRDFATRFERIEDNAEAGLYVILCNLHVVMRNLSIEAMSPETAAEVASIRFEEGLSNAIRHVRDYIVLLVLENSAEELSSRFNRLVGQVASPNTASTAQ